MWWKSGGSGFTSSSSLGRTSSRDRRLWKAAIVAEAATALGKHVVQTQSYGPAARGGASKAEAIISDAEIDYPEVDTPDVSLCLSQEAYEKYANDFVAETMASDYAGALKVAEDAKGAWG